jgi:lipoic acid synthetase
MDKQADKTPQRRRHPEWIRAHLAHTERSGSVRGVLAAHGLHTVCQEARCPNRGECWDAGAATFLILGDTCTRNCRYCSVAHAAPGPPDPGEPHRVAQAARDLGCHYVVVTSVTRDDLPDGGAEHFAQVVQTLRAAISGVRVELLVPDFLGEEHAALIVADSQPTVLGHNIETVRRLFPDVRPAGNYDRSLNLLRMWKRERPALTIKSGLMVGLGETRAEITQALCDLRAAGVDIVTVGQYLQPSRDCVPIERYMHPDEFQDIQAQALAMGFSAAVCGPLVRSSYHAEDAANAARQDNTNS